MENRESVSVSHSDSVTDSQGQEQYQISEAQYEEQINYRSEAGMNIGHPSCPRELEMPNESNSQDSYYEGEDIFFLMERWGWDGSNEVLWKIWDQLGLWNWEWRCQRKIFKFWVGFEVGVRKNELDVGGEVRKWRGTVGDVSGRKALFIK